MADDMDVDSPATGSGKNAKDDGKEKKRFEVKKVRTPLLLIDLLLDALQWNAVALWAWGAYRYRRSAAQTSPAHRHRSR